jgi:AcrR family transcriptional regulator
MESHEKTSRYHHGDLRNALLAAALTLLEEEGAAGLDLRKVARRAGVSHTAPYRHFADKHALLAAIAEIGFNRLAERMTEALTSSPPVLEERLFALGHAYISFGLHHRAHARLMFSSFGMARAEDIALHAAAKRCFELLASALGDAQANGEIGGALQAHWRSLWSAMHGAMILLIEDQMPYVTAEADGVDTLIRHTIRLMLAGMRP